MQTRIRLDEKDYRLSLSLPSLYKKKITLGRIQITVLNYWNVMMHS